jgi:tetratricopeptide (TPR) repeat protein
MRDTGYAQRVKHPASRIRHLASVVLGVALMLPAFGGEERPAKAAPQALRIPKPEKPLAVPGGEAQPGWAALLKNDFAAAETAFREALKNKPNDLYILEGLRAAMITRGRYKEAQQINLQMLAAGADSPLGNVFALRAMDALPFVESRAELMEAFQKVSRTACPAVESILKDDIATLYFQTNRSEEARQALAGLGYVDRWIFVAGPFGRTDRNNPIEKRFAPERPWTTLDFTDESGEKAEVRKDVTNDNRGLDLDSLFPGARGIFYAFANLESDADQDVVLGVTASMPYRVYLRGLPILQEPEAPRYRWGGHGRRAGGELRRVKLVRGANPLLVKLSSTASVTVRVFSKEFGLAKGVKAAGADGETRGIVPVRGFLFATETRGSTATYLLDRFGKAAAQPETQDGDPLEALVTGATFSAAEASWLDLALQRESAADARTALARLLAGSFPDSVWALEISASILNATGLAAGSGSGREAEEARQLNERALTILPTSHQHLLAVYFFLLDHGMLDQALERIKACVAAHPDSALAHAHLADAYGRKRLPADAQRHYERAAELDEAYLPQLVSFHEREGQPARARELRQKLVAQGRWAVEAQFDDALRRGDMQTAEKLLGRWEQESPGRKEELAQARVRLLLEKGDLKEACKLRRKLYESQPSYDGGRRYALTALVDLTLRLGKDDEARELLRGYLKENQGDSELRELLAALEDRVLPRWWEPYDVKVAAVDTSRFTVQSYPASNHAWIVDFMVTRVLPDYSTESYVHIAQKVLNVQGINELSELLVRAQKQDLLFVRTVNPDGSVYQPENLHDFNLEQSASLYKVGPGSILEHAYVMRAPADKDDPSFHMGFNFNAIDAPRAVSRWVVMIPDELKDKLRTRRIRPEMVEEKVLPGPAGYTVHQWTNTQVEGIKAEPFMPTENDQEVIPLVLIERRGQPFRATGLLMRRDRDDLPREAVEEARRIVNPAFLKKNDDASKFLALVAWVRTNIQPGQDARTLADVWFSRSGRPDQMTSLAWEMALSAGLPVRAAAVNGSYNPGRAWRTKYADTEWEPGALAAFGSGGRMLVLEQPGARDLWVQFSGRAPKYHWPEDISATQAGMLALTFGDENNPAGGGARVKRVEGEALGLTLGASRIEVGLDANGTGTATGTQSLHGQLGALWREALADPRRRPQVLEWPVRQAWPKSEIKNVAAANEERPDRPLVFKYACVVKGLATPADGALFLPPFFMRPRILELRGPAERQHDLVLRSETAELDHTLTYIAPPDHAWVEVPDDIFVCTEFGFYLADFTIKGRVLTCTCSYLMPAQRIPPEKYGALQEFLQAVAASSQQRIAYGPLKETSLREYQREVSSMGYVSSGQEAKKP